MGAVYLGDFSRWGERGGDDQIFGWLEDSPPIPPVEKILMVGFGEVHEGFQDWINK